MKIKINIVVVIKDEEIKQKIIEILKERPGLTVENLAEEIGAHRHTIAKYLLELKGAGKIQKRRIGTAVLHYLSEQIDEKAVIGEPIEESVEGVDTEGEKEDEKIEKPIEKEDIAEERKPEELELVKRKWSPNKRIFKYSVISLSIVVLLIAIYFIGPKVTGLFAFGGTLDKTSGLFITSDNSLSKNELGIYALLKNYGGNVSKVKISDIQRINLSEYDYMAISIDASAFITDEICQLIADSNTSFIYSSRNFNSKCTDELQLTAGSLCGPSESPEWEIINNSYYPTSHISYVPQKVKIFVDEFSVELCTVEGSSFYSRPIILASRDQTHGYLAIFKDDLQRRAFFAFPSREFDLTEEGKTLLSRTIIWLIGK